MSVLSGSEDGGRTGPCGRAFQADRQKESLWMIQFNFLFCLGVCVMCNGDDVDIVTDCALYET